MSDKVPAVDQPGAREMDPQLYLYKVTPPRPDMLFQPSTFWRTKNWESSTTRAKEGYIEDSVLFAGDFDEVSIHLFPRVRTVRVRARDVGAVRLGSLGMECRPGAATHIFAPSARKADIESFCPTVFTFARDGFTHVRNGEYVSRRPQRALSFETIPMAEALNRWNVDACYVEDLDSIIQALSGAGIYFEQQT
jgi:hypothetical protein